MPKQYTERSLYNNNNNSKNKNFLSKWTFLLFTKVLIHCYILRMTPNSNILAHIFFAKLVSINT